MMRTGDPYLIEADAPSPRSQVDDQRLATGLTGTHPFIPDDHGRKAGEHCVIEHHNDRHLYVTPLTEDVARSEQCSIGPGRFLGIYCKHNRSG